MSCLDIAHRGASHDAPENTLEAFELAVAQGADMIETDLHQLRDGTIVLLHDTELDGCLLGALDRAELSELAPSVPTLDEALDAVGARVPFNLEIKGGPETDYAGLPARALEAVRKRGWLEKTLFSSFYDGALAELRGLDAGVRIGLLISRKAPVAIAERASRLGAEAVHPDRSVLTRELVDEIHANGYRVNVFTVDDETDLHRVLEWGVDGIFTNVPARLRAILDR